MTKLLFKIYKKQALHDITGQLHYTLHITPWYVVCGMWYVVCGMWYMVYGIWYMELAGDVM